MLISVTELIKKLLTNSRQYSRAQSGGKKSAHVSANHKTFHLRVFRQWREKSEWGPRHELAVGSNRFCNW